MKRIRWIIAGLCLLGIGGGLMLIFSDNSIQGDLKLVPYVADETYEQSVITVNQESINLGMLMEEIRKKGGHLPGRFDDDEQRQQVINELVHFELLAQEAQKLNYHNDPEIQLAYKKLLVAKFKREQIQSKLSEIIITKEMVEDYYEDHINSYKEPGMAHLAMIFLRKSAIADKKETRKLEQKISQVRKMALQQKTPDFGKLAGKYSDDLQTKYKGGALPWLNRNARHFRLEPEIVQAAFKLNNKGDISKPIETDNGFYLLKLIDRRTEKTKPLEAVRLQIQADLMASLKQQWLDQFYQNLEEKAQITKNNKLLGEDVVWKSQTMVASQIPTFPAK